MGTRFELVLPAGDTNRAAGEAALEEVLGCHHRYSRFDEASLLNHILHTGPATPVALDRDTVALLQDALLVWRDSGGAFDPTAPHATMDALCLDVPRSRVHLTRPISSLDLGGIAKGHALDVAARVLRLSGVTRAFLHGGTSSVVAIGAPAGQSGWSVQLPDGGQLLLNDAALSVSAVWEGNPHPTLDPRSGEPVAGPRTACVVGPSARLADAWSTAVLVLGHTPPTFPAGYTARVMTA